MSSSGARLLALSSLLLTIAGLPARVVQAEASLNGTVASVPSGARRIILDTGLLRVTLLVNDATWITRDRIDCPVTAIRVGDRVRCMAATSSAGWVAVRIEAFSKGKRVVLKGTIAALPSDGRSLLLDEGKRPQPPTWIQVDAATLITRDVLPAAWDDLRVSDRATVIAEMRETGSATPVCLANLIEATSSQSKARFLVTGTLKSVSGTSLVIQTHRSGIDEILIVDPSRMVRRDGKPTSLTQLQRGDQITAVASRNSDRTASAWMVSAQSPDIDLHGTIVTVNMSEGWITVAIDSSSAPVPLRWLPSTVVQVNGQDADISDIQPNDLASISAIVHREGPWGVLRLDITRPANLATR